MLMRPVMQRPLGRSQRGLSIVELMVGVTVGLIVVAAASLVMAGQLTENRKLLASAQLQQDLRAAADIMARELRRSSYMSETGGSGTPGSLDTLDAAVQVGAVGVVRANSFQPTLAISSGGTQIAYGYRASTTGVIANAFGFRLNTTTGTIQSNLGNSAGYQDLTDANTVKVTGLTFTLSTTASPTESVPCTKACSDGTTNCWPTVNVRWVNYVITAESRSDPAIKRELKGEVRVRGDRVNFATSSQVCPL